VYPYDTFILKKVYSGENLKVKKAVRTSLSDYKEESWMVNVPLYGIGASGTYDF
jgi:hypothetical protein